MINMQSYTITLTTREVLALARQLLDRLDRIDQGSLQEYVHLKTSWEPPRSFSIRIDTQEIK